MCISYASSVDFLKQWRYSRHPHIAGNGWKTSEEKDKAPQMACQDSVGCSWMSINSINLYKILLLVCKKIYSDNDFIISLWRYSSGINCFRGKCDHLATVLICKFLNLRIKIIFFKDVTYFQVTHMAVHSLSVDLSAFPCLCPICVIVFTSV